jgi:hypothetical protein
MGKLKKIDKRINKDGEYYFIQWNELHCKHVHDGDADYRNNKMADYCEEMILKAKVKYYKGTPIMSDRQYDKFEYYLTVLRPNSKTLTKVG